MSIERLAHASGAPGDILIARLDATLRSYAPDAFAGLAIAPDGAIEVYIGGFETAASELVSATVAETQAALAIGCSLPIVRLIPGQRNSLATLESVHGALRARYHELRAVGIQVVRSGVDVRLNRLHIGVSHLTPETEMSLQAQFGAELINMGEDEPFYGYVEGRNPAT